MERQDRDMPFLLKYENVAWYDGGKVRILDRRVFPEVRFVECATYQEVRQAVADMVWSYQKQEELSEEESSPPPPNGAGGE